jgi:hypothetical protein
LVFFRSGSGFALALNPKTSSNPGLNLNLKARVWLPVYVLSPLFLHHIIIIILPYIEFWK